MWGLTVPYLAGLCVALRHLGCALGRGEGAPKRGPTRRPVPIRSLGRKGRLR